MAGFDLFGGLGGLGGTPGATSGAPNFDWQALLGGLGQSLLTSPRYAPLSGLPAGIQAARERSRQTGSDVAMKLALTKAGVDPQTAATLALNPTAAALMISQGNAEKQQAFRLKAMESLGGGSLVPPGAEATTPTTSGSGTGGLGGLGGVPSFAGASGPEGAYLGRLVQRESGGNPNAQAATSSAFGPVQFTKGTWDDTVKAHPELGLTSADFSSPEKHGPAAIAFTRDNAKALAEAGQDPSDPANLYAAHFLGRSGGVRFLNGLRVNPNAPAASYVASDQAAANRPIFFNKDGSPKTAGQVYANFRNSFGGASSGGSTLADAGVAPLDSGAPVRLAQADTGTATDALPTNQFAGPGAKIPAASPDRTLPPVSAPPAGVNQTRAWANREAQRALGVMAGAGEDKGLMEAAKARFEAVKGYLTQSEAEKNLAAAGIDPTSRAGREALTGGVGIKLEQLGLDKQKQQLEGDKFDYERFKTDRAYQQEVQNQNRTTETKNYDAYAAQERAAGREPLSRFNFEREMKQSGATKIDLAEKRQSAFDQKRDEVNVKRFSGMIEEGDSAASDLSLIRQLRQMGGAIDQKSLPALRGWLADKGVKVGDDIGVIEAYNSVLDRMTPAQRQGMPGAASDRDVSMFRGSLPSLLKTPGGNAIVTDTMEALALHKQQRAAIADKVIQGEITPQQGTEAIRNLPDPLATFKDFRSEGITAESENAPKQPPLIYTGRQYDALPIGSSYRDAKGQLRKKVAERPKEEAGAQ